MIIFIGLILIVVAGFVVIHHTKEYSDWEYASRIIPILGIVCLFIAAICLPVSYYGTIIDIQKFKMAKTMIENPVKTMTEIERAAMMNRAIDYNLWLVKEKYWNKTTFDIFIPDEIEKLEFIKS